MIRFVRPFFGSRSYDRATGRLIASQTEAQYTMHAYGSPAAEAQGKRVAARIAKAKAEAKAQTRGVIASGVTFYKAEPDAQAAAEAEAPAADPRHRHPVLHPRKAAHASRWLELVEDRGPVELGTDDDARTWYLDNDHIDFKVPGGD